MKEYLSNKKLKFAIIGAGNGGQAFAGYLANKGYAVNLYNRTMEKIEKIKQRGYIDLEGSITGRGKLDLVTNNMEQAIKNMDVIMIVVPASGHKFIANEIAPFITEKQYIVLNPGRTGGALEFNSIIKRRNPSTNICIVEAQTLLFTCRAVEQGEVQIFSKKNEVKVAVLPAVKNNEFIHMIGDAFPEFTLAESVLETSFNNIGAVLHPIVTILNCGRIEDTKGDFQFYIDGVTPSVAKIIEAVDYERMQVVKALGVDALSLKDWLGITYNAYGDTLCETLNNTEAYRGIKAPENINTRYIFEDVPQSLVPICDMANHLMIKTPTIDSMIYLASVLHNTDYWQSGRKLIDMGVEGLSLEEIKEFVKTSKMSDSRGVAI